MRTRYTWNNLRDDIEIVNADMTDINAPYLYAATEEEEGATVYIAKPDLAKNTNTHLRLAHGTPAECCQAMTSHAYKQLLESRREQS